jgi:hypothetical protein
MPANEKPPAKLVDIYLPKIKNLSQIDVIHYTISILANVVTLQSLRDSSPY